MNGFQPKYHHALILLAYARSQKSWERPLFIISLTQKSESDQVFTLGDMNALYRSTFAIRHQDRWSLNSTRPDNEGSAD